MNIDFSVRLPAAGRCAQRPPGAWADAAGAGSPPGPAAGRRGDRARAHRGLRERGRPHGHENYQVDVSIDEQLCTISVLGDGGGFDVAGATETDPAPTDDRGRGLMLTRALVDRLQFGEDQDGRHRVMVEKRLVTQPRLRLLEPH